VAGIVLAWYGLALAGVTAQPVFPLDELYKEYQTLGLPLPPKTAKLVRYEAGGGGVVNGKVQPKEYSLAFQVKPGIKDESHHLLRGVHQWEPAWNPHAQEVAPNAAAITDLVLYADDLLVLAIQCHARGWDDLARHLLTRNQQKTKVPPRDQLRRLAWFYWLDQLTQPAIDRAPVAKRLKDLMRQDQELDTETNRALLKSLDLALVPSKARPGSIEELIDNLVDYGATTGTIGIFSPEERYWRIAALGFDAVPSLIEHLDDDRLTRAIMQGFNNFPPWNLRVGDVVSDLLEGLAGHDIGRNWLRRQQGYGVEKAEAAKWWAAAGKVGEEAYLLGHVLPADTKEEDRQADVSAHLVYVIREKYPRHLPTLYRTVLNQRPQLDSRLLVHAVLRSKLPAKEKRDLVLEGVKHKENQHRLPALHALRDVDKKEFTALVLPIIESIPQDVPGPYWKCGEAYLVRLAMEVDDLRVWPAVEKAARRASLGLRMELLNQLCDPKDPRHRRERLGLLASFLEDGALRDTEASSKFQGPCAGFLYHKLAVRDFVALEIAKLIEIEIELDLERTPEQWAKVRQQVREALKRESGPAPDRN
jgi:hypothetical protein